MCLLLDAPTPVSYGLEATAQQRRRGGESGGRPVSSASVQEKLTAGLTAAAVAVALVLLEVAEAASPGLSPLLKNFLLSIVSDGVVFAGIAGSVIAVYNVDPVKRT
ncbi:hypothetical protein ZWY2020_030899 [Hordeum vulgare]|nr:hypothetical protein ZWY2020_030899 [Hordeum vulgare]